MNVKGMSYWSYMRHNNTPHKTKYSTIITQCRKYMDKHCGLIYPEEIKTICKEHNINYDTLPKEDQHYIWEKVRTGE